MCSPPLLWPLPRPWSWGPGRPGRRHQPERLGPLQGRRRHHPLLVGPLRVGLDGIQEDPEGERERRARVGQPDGPPGEGLHRDSGHRRHLLCQGQRQRTRGPGRARFLPGGRSRRAVDRVLDRQHGLRPGCRGGPLHRPGQGTGPESPALARPRRQARRRGGRRHRRDPGDRQEVRTRRALHPGPGTHVPVEEDSVNAKGQHTDDEHIVYSRWGEQVRPEAPKATISVGSINAV